MEEIHENECKPCTRCKAQYVPPHYYIEELKICQTCDQLSKGGTRQCNTCSEIKDITLFERPSLTRCKQCAAKRTKQRYDKCSGYTKCECGTVIKAATIRHHLKSKKHSNLMLFSN
jgi:hypothetical protein